MPDVSRSMFSRSSVVILSAFLTGSQLLAQTPDPGAVVQVTVSTGRGPAHAAQVRSGALSETTDIRGRATLRLSAGDYTVVATQIGWLPDSVTLSLREGQDTSVALRLEEELVELEEVTVSSTRSDRRIEDQPLRVEMLGREEIEEKLLMTPGDISMLLNETGGMRVQNTSPSLGGANVRIQGLRGRYSLLLSDGLPLYGGQAGGLGLLQVPPMDLGQVEIIKGAASALYGSSALGGVINLLSRKPDGSRELLVNGTTLGGADGVLWTTGKLDERWGYTFLGSGHRQGRIDQDEDGWSDVPGYRRAVARPRLFWDNGEGQTLLFTAGLTVEGREGGTVSGALAPDGEPYAEDLTTTRLDLGSVGRFTLAPGWLLTSRVSGMTQRHRHTFGAELERDRHSTGFGEVALSRSTARGVSVLGLAFQHDRYRNRELPQFDFAHAVPGLFLHQEWMPDPRVTVAASARLDHHSAYGTFVNPRFSALLKTGGSWTLRVSGGTGFYGPTPFTEETEVTGLALLAPLGELEAEKARSGSVDVGGTVGPFEVTGTVFGSVIDRAVQLSDISDVEGRFSLINADGPTRTWGGELLSRYGHDPWHFTASYTYTRSTEPRPGGELRREVALTPRHSFGLVGMWEEEGRMRVGMEFYYTGRQTLEDNPYRDRSEPYAIIGALAEHRVGPARLFINFENITNVRQTKYDRLVLPTRSPDGRWTTDAWAPLDGRVVNGGARVYF